MCNEQAPIKPTKKFMLRRSLSSKECNIEIGIPGKKSVLPSRQCFTLGKVHQRHYHEPRGSDCNQSVSQLLSCPQYKGTLDFVWIADWREQSNEVEGGYGILIRCEVSIMRSLPIANI
jgi:hypothetical protein